MKYLFLLLLSIGVTKSISAQNDTPIGKWIMTKHYILTYDSTNNYWIHTNVFNNEFKLIVEFKPDGKFIYNLADSVVYHGSWKLSKKGRKLRIKYKTNSRNRRFSSTSKRPKNF